jgi:hypothetical protein
MTTRTQTRILRQNAPRRFDWLAALALLIAGVGGFYTVVTTVSPITGSIEGGLPDAVYAQRFLTSPNVAGVALLLISLLATTLGGAWFVVRLLHWRFRSAFEPLTVWRQSLWVALFVTIGAWLQLNRSLTMPLAALVGGGFVLIEVLLNVRERQE